MKELQRAIQSIDINDLGSRELLHSRIKEKALSIPSTTCAPVYLLTYSVRNILYPQFAYHFTYDLLNVLVQIEEYRRKAVLNAKNALVWNKHYEGRNAESAQAKEPIVPVLNKEQKSFLKRSIDETRIDDMRFRYTSLVSFLCELHIRKLWVAEDSYKIPVRMKAYFPSLFAKEDESAFEEKFWSALFLQDLSDSERQEHHTKGERAKDFLVEARKWDNEREAFWSSQGQPEMAFAEEDQVSYSRDFRNAFVNELEALTLKTLEGYLKRVEELVTTLESYFRQPDYEAETS